MNELDELIRLGVRAREREALKAFIGAVKRELQMDRLGAEGQPVDYKNGWNDAITRVLERLDDFDFG